MPLSSTASAKRTKIVCTIGPASSSETTLRDMIKAGMNVARLNFSHGTADSNLELLEKIRRAADKVGQNVAILLDLQGPKVRIGHLPGEGLELIEGKVAYLKAGASVADPGVIPVPYERLAHDLKPHDRILLADGTRELEVMEVKGKMIKARVLLGGRVISHKGINVPTVRLAVEAITEKDIRDLAFGLKQNIDFVALSFVRSAEDVQELRRLIKKYLPADLTPPAVVVKIEKHEALEHFDEILEATDAVMIARGDLGLETPVTRVPVHQKELIAKCLVAGKPVITATEMLASMEHNPRPTRAEVSDVANAVIDHTDAVMLSGESAMGRFPVRAVDTMAEVIRNTEESPLDNLKPQPGSSHESIPFAVAASAVDLARSVGAAAILVTTASGYSARAIARFRPEIPLFAATESARTRNILLLSSGVTPFLAEGYSTPEQMLQQALEMLKKKYKVKAKSRVVVMSGLARSTKGYDSVVRVVEL
jgi:pyruvate kinase